MWKPIALVALSLALEGAFVLQAVVPDAGPARRPAAEARARPVEAPAARAISDGALARTR
jgi:hypothetical protein